MVYSAKMFCTAVMRLDGAVEHREVTVGVDVCPWKMLLTIVCRIALLLYYITIRIVRILNVLW